MSAITIWRGYDHDLTYTAKDKDGNARDLSGYNKVRIDIRETLKDGTKVARLALLGTITQESPTVKRGQMVFAITRSATEGWTGDVRMQHQVSARRTADGQWHPLEGPDPVAVRDRLAETLETDP